MVKIRNLIIGSCFAITSPYLASAQDTPQSQWDMLRMHMYARQQAKLDPLTSDESLCEIAQRHADWMAKNDKVVHQNLKPILGKPWRMVGENIAAYYNNDGDCFKGWMGSKGHRSNILNSGFTHVGFGQGKRGKKIYWCAVFGSKKN